MSSLDDLLAVQELDTRADQLRHRRETLPEIGELAAARAALASGQAAVDEVSGRLRGIRVREQALEDEAALVADKAAEVDRKLYDGSVVAHKELEAYQADHRMLKERQGQLEDQAIVLMEEAEPVEAELAEARERVERARAEHDRVEATLTASRAGIDEELAGVEARRAEAAGGIPAEVLAAYEPLRERLGGIGAARLVGPRCEGCHLEIPSAELEAVRSAPPDALVHCPECGRLLVR